MEKYFGPDRRLYFCPLQLLACVTAVWSGGEGWLFVAAAHHTASHMNASVMDGCSLGLNWMKSACFWIKQRGKYICQSFTDLLISVLPADFPLFHPAGSFDGKCTDKQPHVTPSENLKRCHMTSGMTVRAPMSMLMEIILGGRHN